MGYNLNKLNEKNPESVPKKEMSPDFLFTSVVLLYIRTK